MASVNRDNIGRNVDASDPIPLQDLSGARNLDPRRAHTTAGHRTLIRGSTFGAELGRRLSLNRSPRSYDRLTDSGNGLGPHQSVPVRSPTEVPDLQVPNYNGEDDGGMPTSIDFREGFEAVIGRETTRGGSWLSPRNLNEAVPGWAPNDDDDSLLPGTEDYGSEDDTARLTDPHNQQIAAGFSPTTGRASMQSVRFPPGPSLGDDLHVAEEGLSRNVSGVSRSTSGAKLSPSRSTSVNKSSRSLSPGPSPVRRVSVAVQNMSQRVVNLSNDPEAVESTIRRRGSTRSDHGDGGGRRRPPIPNIQVHAYDGDDGEEKVSTPLQKESRRSWHDTANPLRGNTLRIFSPTSRVRVFLCDVLIHPATEPLLLLLILIQTILLTIDAAPSVYNDPRDLAWGTSGIDYAMLVLFIIYTYVFHLVLTGGANFPDVCRLEIAARCIVSGLYLNPHHNGDRGEFRRRMKEKVEKLVSPGKLQDRTASPTRMEEPPSLFRSITNLNMAEGAAVPATVQSQARTRLARRAFLRHSFNRLDFVAVCSYWISLGICLTGYEAERHLYVFRMMGCLRILRLLGITSGTSVILRSLKKAAPLLVHVAFLIGFFWLVFAVVGVQSFKGSLRRNCVWIDPAGIQENYTQEFQFCGGHLDIDTGIALPFVHTDGTPGAKTAKGYICPTFSKCISDQNPYGGTISFDNIIQSIELVFVVMTANTFSNLLYYTADSDYLAASLCKLPLSTVIGKHC